MIEKILKEINRLKEELDGYSALEALDYIEAYINTLPEESKCIYNRTLEERKKFCKYCSAACDVRIEEEPASEDWEEEIKNYFSGWLMSTREQEWFFQTARHFAEWQKQQDEKLFKEDTWNYIEEQYPDVTKEEKLRLYDVSIKSRLAGANTIKQQMKEALQTEYEKGRFDMREEMMKDAREADVIVDRIGEVVYLCPHISEKTFDKVKIIIIEEEQL